jgi:hypothetical protein
MAEPKNHATPVENRPAEDKRAENPRDAIREARKRRLRVIDGPPTTVKVYAAGEDLRAVLRHANGTRFRASLDQAVEWPNDNFTARRIADGSVSTSPASGERAAPDPSKNPREQAAANKPKSEAESESKPEPRQHSHPQPPAD